MGGAGGRPREARSAINKLQPHRVSTFKLSTDPRFEEKLVDVVGLYLNPPDRAVVLCMDEKSQIQALDRTQRSLPMKPGRAGTMTHDYKRNGTTTLFAALDVLNGTVIGQCLPRHRHEEFLRFLRRIDREVPAHLGIHMILDNYATHKHAEVAAWLRRGAARPPAAADVREELETGETVTLTASEPDESLAQPLRSIGRTFRIEFAWKAAK
jgi:DDE superfamily endonuclease